MKKTLVLLALSLLLLCSVYGAGAQETNQKGAEKQVVTLRISHNMDFTTIPEAVVDAAARVNARYEQEGKPITIAFERTTRPSIGRSIKTISSLPIKSMMHRTSLQ
jgi:hypothetical protein